MAQPSSDRLGAAQMLGPAFDLDTITGRGPYVIDGERSQSGPSPDRNQVGKVTPDRPSRPGRIDRDAGYEYDQSSDHSDGEHGPDDGDNNGLAVEVSYTSS